LGSIIIGFNHFFGSHQSTSKSRQSNTDTLQPL
jgi:hypothetical protein